MLVATLTMTLQPMASQAQAFDQNAFQTFTQSSFYQRLITRTLAALPQTVFQRCPSLVSQGSKVVTLKSVTFGADGFPNAGVWRQEFPISGCGNDTTLNFYFFATSDEKINTLVAAPGTTHANTVLQSDARKYATIAVLAAHKGCETLDIKSTRFEGYGLANPPTPDPGSGSHLRPWWETWTMVGCGQTYDVPIDFLPDATGVQVIQPRGIVQR